MAEKQPYIPNNEREISQYIDWPVVSGADPDIALRHWLSSQKFPTLGNRWVLTDFHGPTTEGDNLIIRPGPYVQAFTERRIAVTPEGHDAAHFADLILITHDSWFADVLQDAAVKAQAEDLSDADEQKIDPTEIDKWLQGDNSSFRGEHASLLTGKFDSLIDGIYFASKGRKNDGLSHFEYLIEGGRGALSEIISMSGYALMPFEHQLQHGRLLTSFGLSASK
jgi:hypothetical protein